jgi:transposase-like protein
MIEPAPVPCPFCKSHDTRRLSDFGTSLMVASYACNRCHSYFEAIKWGETMPRPNERTRES